MEGGGAHMMNSWRMGSFESLTRDEQRVGEEV